MTSRKGEKETGSPFGGVSISQRFDLSVKIWGNLFSQGANKEQKTKH